MKNLTRKQVLELGRIIASMYNSDIASSGEVHELEFFCVKYSNVSKEKLDRFTFNEANRLYNRSKKK